jgi:hypothetical protein
MLRVHVRLDLEHEARKRGLGGTDDARAEPSRGCGGGAQSINAWRISCTPKLLMAEPKNTGV